MPNKVVPTMPNKKTFWPSSTHTLIDVDLLELADAVVFCILNGLGNSNEKKN